jgi:hypothetical protein
MRGPIGEQGHQFRGDISNSGEVIWQQTDLVDSELRQQVHSTTRGVVVPADSLGGGPNESSAIGNSGEILYRGERPIGASRFTDTGIYSTTRGPVLVEEDEHLFLSVTDTGTVTWYGIDAYGVFQLYGLHDGQVQQITTGPRPTRWSDINDQGEIVFLSHDLNGAYQVFKLTPTAEGDLPIDPMLVLHPEIRDSDDDGVPDVYDAFPEEPAAFADSDGDGVSDSQDDDRPFVTAFVGDALDWTIAADDLRDPADDAQSGLIGAGMSIPGRSLDKAFIVTADLGDTAQYYPGGRLVAGGRDQLILGWPLRLGPSGTNLAQDATVTLPYDLSLLSEVLFGTLRVARIDDDGTVTPLASLDSGLAGTVTVSPGHFSQFVVVGQSLSSGGGGGCTAARGGADSGGAAAVLLVPLMVLAACRLRPR